MPRFERRTKLATLKQYRPVSPVDESIMRLGVAADTMEALEASAGGRTSLLLTSRRKGILIEALADWIETELNTLDEEDDDGQS